MSDDPSNNTQYPVPPRRRGNAVGWIVALGFIALVAWFVWNYMFPGTVVL